MPLAASAMPAGHNLIAALDEAVAAAEALFADARRAVAARVTVEGRPMARVFDREQRATHGLAWLATYVEAIRQLAAYAERMIDAGNFGEIEELVVRIGAGEYLAQILGGIPMSQGEIVRPADLGLDARARWRRGSRPPSMHLIATGNTAAHRARLVELMREQPRRHRRRLRPRRHAGFDPRGDAQIRRQRGRAACASVAPRQRTTSRSTSSRRCPSSACSASPSPRITAAWGSARNRCASSPRSCRAAISASARSAPAPRSPPS